MSMVGTNLPNTDAISSIRGIYGGVGLVISIQLIYLLFKNVSKGLLFLILFWGAYAISRLIIMIVDGPLGDFGTNWIVIESVFCLIAILLYYLGRKQEANKN